MAKNERLPENSKGSRGLGSFYSRATTKPRVEGIKSNGSSTIFNMEEEVALKHFAVRIAKKKNA